MDQGSRIVYTRNPDYWDDPKPYLNGLVIKFIKDPAERTSAIEKGVIQLAPGAPVPPEDLDRLRSNSNLNSKAGVTPIPTKWCGLSSISTIRPCAM